MGLREYRQHPRDAAVRQGVKCEEAHLCDLSVRPESSPSVVTEEDYRDVAQFWIALCVANHVDVDVKPGFLLQLAAQCPSQILVSAHEACGKPPGMPDLIGVLE